ncbi:MAG: glycosyltransferase family 4 protein [Armatimonadetes bacterium]|nr:glycosyltransferase family 4 protein [Armatimonadota bacterium]
MSEARQAQNPAHLRSGGIGASGSGLHVLYIHQHFTTNEVPFGPRSYDYARYLVRMGHRVTVLCGSTFLGKTKLAQSKRGLVRHLTAEGIEIVMIAVPYSNYMGFLGRALSFLAFAFLATISALMVRDVDVVYATSTPLTVGLPALACRFFRGIPYCFEVRDLWPEIPVALGILKNRILIAISERAETAFYRHAHTVVGISQGIVDRLAARGVPRERLAVLYSGVDLALYDNTSPDPAGIAALGLGNRFVAVYAGSVSTVNHLDYLLDVAARVTPDPRIAILIIGDGRERPRLETEARQRGLGNVVFAGPFPKAQLAGLLKASHVGINSAKDMEVFRPVMANKFFDYLGAGLPIVSNHPAEITRFLEELKIGKEFPADDPSSMAAFFVWLADNPAAREDMGRRAHDAAKNRFDRRELVKTLEAIILAAAIKKSHKGAAPV